MPNSKHTTLGRRLIAAAQEVVDAKEAGVPMSKRFSVRTVKIPDPRQYTAASVRETRRRIGVSQKVFARLVGVSAILAQSWEQGKRVPSPLARRLLDEINRDPQHWQRMVG